MNARHNYDSGNDVIRNKNSKKERQLSALFEVARAAHDSDAGVEHPLTNIEILFKVTSSFLGFDCTGLESGVEKRVRKAKHLDKMLHT